jgi:hypothetical protein
MFDIQVRCIWLGRYLMEVVKELFQDLREQGVDPGMGRFHLLQNLVEECPVARMLFPPPRGPRHLLANVVQRGHESRRSVLVSVADALLGQSCL